MKLRAVILTMLAGVAFWLRAADAPVAPGLPTSLKDVRTSEFSSEQYFDPPNETKIKLRLSGASVSPLPGGLQEVTALRIEMFGTNGAARLVAEAPKCQMSPFDNVASSPGRLVMNSGDGRFHVEGDGFMWQQNEMTLTISNHVHTVLKMGTNSLFKL